MTRSAFYDTRLAHWQEHGRVSMGEDLDPEAQALRDVEAAEAAGKTWDPEERGLPKRITLGIRDDGRCSLLAVDGPGFDERAIYDAAIAAYNWSRPGRVRSLDQWQAAAEELVRGERARCAGIVKWLQADLSEEFCGEPIAEALRRIEHGRPQPPAWTGADDLPNPPGTGSGPWPKQGREWPVALEPIPAGLPGYYYLSRRSMGSAVLTLEEAREAARRWKSEPELREEVENWRLTARQNGDMAEERWNRIERAVNYIRAQRSRVGGTIDGDGILGQVVRILTGKEF